MHNKLIIFDWGGVIESHNIKEHDFHKCWIEILKTFNINVTNKEIDNMYKELFINKENNIHIETTTKKVEVEKWIKRIENYFNFTCTTEEFLKVYIKEFSKIDYYKNVINFIHSLKGITKIAICSNLTIIDKKRLDIQVNTNLLDYIFLSCDISIRKPQTEIYEYIEKQTNIQPENILLIDDNEENIEKAKERNWNVCYATGHELTKIASSVYKFLDIKPEIVKVEKFDHFGRGLAHIDGKATFIENALPKEEVEIKILKENKNYLEAMVTACYKESKERRKPLCPKYYECGGCNLQHLSFEQENNFKKDKVSELIEKFTSLNKNIIENPISTEEYNYRNKITLHGKNNIIGYHKSKSNYIIPISNCPIVSEKINILIKEINKIDHNINELIVRTSNDEEKIMVKIKGEINNYQSLLPYTDVLIINDKIITNSSQIITTIKDKKYFLSIDSFFQVNKTLTEKLYDEVRKIVKETKPNKVLDLYCGTGTIGIYVSNYAKEVIGIDYSKSGIENANQNKELNNTKNISFICDKVENVIDKFTNDIDLIIVDPPRAGLDKKTINNLKRINPKEIIYVSCDPATLARDLNLLNENYDVKFIKPYNMFPKTYHVENLCYLKIRKYQRLEGENIVLRKAVKEDLETIWNNVWSDKTIADNMLWEITKTKEDAEVRMKRTINFQKVHYAYFITLKETDEPIGFAGIIETQQNIYEDTGICIAAKHQKKGYAKEVVKLLRKLIFEELKGERFIYGAFSTNENSKKVCKSLGFKYLDSVKIIREHDNQEFTVEHFYFDKDMYNQE